MDIKEVRNFIKVFIHHPAMRYTVVAKNGTLLLNPDERFTMNIPVVHDKMYRKWEDMGIIIVHERKGGALMSFDIVISIPQLTIDVLEFDKL